MKKILICLFFLFISLMSCLSQTTFMIDSCRFVNEILASAPTCTIENVSNGIIVSYHFENINIYPDRFDSTAHVLRLDGFEPIHEKGKPSVPIRWDSFIIPQGKTYTVSVIDSSYINLPIKVAPSIPLLTEWEMENLSDSIIPIVPYSGSFPQSYISSIDTIEYRGENIIDICISPIKYHYTNMSAQICNYITYKISWSQQGGSFLPPKIIPHHVMHNLVLNYYEGNDSTNESTPVTEDYLIVTTSKFVNAATKLAEWKRTLGFRTHLAISNSWAVDSVKNIIRNLYNDSNTNLAYLLLIGDEDDVPAANRPNNNHQFVPSDLKYSCMGGKSDYVADIYMGRISAHTNNEALTIIDKIINYERNPMQDENFYNSVLVSSFFQALENHPDIDGTPYVETTEDIRNYLEINGKSTYRVYNADFLRFPKYWSNGTLMPEELQDTAVWIGTGEDIKESINRGVSLVLHRDHGIYRGWPFIEFDTICIESLNNGEKLPVVFSIDCDCGQFNYQPTHGNTDCFAETFLKKKGGGCVAIIAATTKTYPGPNDCMAKGFIEAIWPYPGLINYSSNQPDTIKPLYRMGEILQYGLHTIKKNGFGDRNNRKYYICFGDPSMRLYTVSPQPFNNILIDRTSDSIVVNTHGEDAQIGFYNKATGEVSCYTGTHANCGMTGDSVLVCISAPNRIPYIEDLTGTLYIQNETISENKIYRANKISVGSNVTSSKPSGPVVFSGNNVSLIGTEVIIEGHTTIELGTSFEIKNQYGN